MPSLEPLIEKHRSTWTSMMTNAIPIGRGAKPQKLKNATKALGLDSRRINQKVHKE